MSNFDFLLKLKESDGFLGLKKSLYHKDIADSTSLPVLEVPDNCPVSNLKDIEEHLKHSTIIDADNVESYNEANKKVEQLEKEKNRLYHLISELLHSKSRPQKKTQEIKSFCCVATYEVRRELLATIKTLRLFHKQPIYIICDEDVKQFIKPHVKNVRFEVDINRRSRERIKNRFFKERFKNLETFHKTECIFKKMDAISFAMKSHENTMFIDSDLVFVDEVEINSDKEIILSPHYSPSDRVMQVHLNGFFNAGFLFCANKTFAKHWRRIYLTDSRFYEQQGMDYISEKYSIDFFDREYNVGWWQHEERWFENTELKISLDGLRVRCFHVHLDPDYQFGDNYIVKEKNEELKQMLLKYCVDNEKDDVIQILKNFYLI